MCICGTDDIKEICPNTVREFTKEIGVPIALIVNPSIEKITQEIKLFARECPATLRRLEEST